MPGNDDSSYVAPVLRAVDWAASTHVAYRDWASEALGDERQVYARATTSPDAKLVFLAEGAAEELRAVAQGPERLLW